MRGPAVLLSFLASAVVGYPQYGFEPVYRPSQLEGCVRRRTRQEVPQAYHHIHHQQQQQHQPRRGRAELDDFVSQTLTHEPEYHTHRYRQTSSPGEHRVYVESPRLVRQHPDRLCQEHPDMCQPRVRVERVIYVDYPPELEGYYVAPSSLYRRKKKKSSGALERPPMLERVPWERQTLGSVEAARLVEKRAEGAGYHLPEDEAASDVPALTVEDTPGEPSQQLSRREAPEQTPADPETATEMAAAQNELRKGSHRGFPVRLEHREEVEKRNVSARI